MYLTFDLTLHSCVPMVAAEPSDGHPFLRDSKFMEKDQLISMIHLLVKREEEEYNSTCSGEPRAKGYGKGIGGYP